MDSARDLGKQMGTEVFMTFHGMHSRRDSCGILEDTKFIRLGKVLVSI